MLEELLSAAVSQSVAPKPVEWPEPLKSAKVPPPTLYVRLLPNEDYATLTAAEQANPTRFISETYWWIIAQCVVDSTGEQVFASYLKPTLANDGDEVALSEQLAPSSPIALANRLKTKYGHPQGFQYMEVLWEQAMTHNGYLSTKEAKAAKN